MRMTLSELIRLSIDLVLRKIRGFILDRKIDAQYVNRRYYKEMLDEIQRAQAYTDKRIVNLESQRRKI